MTTSNERAELLEFIATGKSSLPFITERDLRIELRFTAARCGKAAVEELLARFEDRLRPPYEPIVDGEARAYQAARRELVLACEALPTKVRIEWSESEDGE